MTILQLLEDNLCRLHLDNNNEPPNPDILVFQVDHVYCKLFGIILEIVSETLIRTTILTPSIVI